MTPPSFPGLELIPGSPFLLGLERLLHAAFLGHDLRPAGAQLIAHLEAFPDDAIRCMDLSFLMQVCGQEGMAAALQGEALSLQRHYRLPTSDRQPVLRLLAIMAPGNFMANTPLEFLLSGSDIALEALYLMPGEPIPAALPPHDALFVAVGESATTRNLLADLCAAADEWGTPVLNHPLHSLLLGRDTVSGLLSGTDGISMPLTARLSRVELAAIAAGAEEKAVLADAQWPLIVRPLDSHAGKGLKKISERTELAAYLAAQPQATEFYLSSFVDYRSRDGLFRKYRIVLVRGVPYLCHMAISTHWMIHYLNADMTDNPTNRTEEARAMQTFERDFAARHQHAFAALHEMFPLDYFGIDCAETPDGKLLIFEVDTGMIVHAMDPVEVFPYKQVAMQKVFHAFQSMVRDAAGRLHG